MSRFAAKTDPVGRVWIEDEDPAEDGELGAHEHIHFPHRRGSRDQKRMLALATRMAVAANQADSQGEDPR